MTPRTPRTPEPRTEARRDERVVVVMPSSRDGERTAAAFAAAGLRCVVCADAAALAHEIGVGAGVALLTEEVLTADPGGALGEALQAQPTWSDLPLVVLSREGTVRRPDRHGAMNVFQVERPVRIQSLLSVVRAALRSRRHQYLVRDHLAALRERDERLGFALSAGRLGAWELDLATERLEGSALFSAAFALPQGGAHSLSGLVEALHPEDRERLAAAVRRAGRGGDIDLELRCARSDGGTRWVLLRGRTPDGERMSGVSLDVTERRRVEEALRDADRRKDEFLATLAHELRNPLAPIRNGVEVLRRSEDRALRERVQEMMERQLGHMVRLIDDLLDVSRLDRNKMELRLARVTLDEVVANAVETARPVIEASGHALELALPPDPLLLDADLTRLAQVFANLLTNSAKYTDPGGRVRLAAHVEAREVVVEVSDTGIGIPAEALPTVFDMFSQVERTHERASGGLGIGLALVRGLVQMHGGTVEAASDGRGRGSTFTVRLPISAQASGGVEPASATSDWS